MQYLFIILIFLSSVSQGVCEIEKYLKKAENKGTMHKMKNIDFIYVINLDERPEKMEKTYQELAPYNIVPYRFSAVNGWKLPNEVINDIGLTFQPGMTHGVMGSQISSEDSVSLKRIEVKNYGETYFAGGMSRGAIGIVLSHLSVLQDAFDSGYQTIWVMEDDIEVVADPTQIPALIELLDKQVGSKNWDVLFTDMDTRDRKGKYVPAAGIAKRPNFTPKNLSKYYIKKNISPEFRRIGARFGAYSMIIRKSGVKKILNFIKKHSIFLPYDLDYYLPEDIKLYTVRSDIIRSKYAITDNAAPNYEKNTAKKSNTKK